MDPSIFPEEIWIKILRYCSVTDILSFCCTCKYLRKVGDTEYLWKLKWQQLKNASPFQFPDKNYLQKLSISFKQMCYRIHMILNPDENTVFVPCYHCDKYMCSQSCIEDHGSRVVMDIGNKWTWIVTPNFGVRRHFSMFGIPKPNLESSASVTGSDEMNTEQNIPTQSHPRNTKALHIHSSGPFCIFCNPVELYREKRLVSRETWERASFRKPSSKYAQIANGFCRDTGQILGIPNVDVVSPAAALLCDGMFHVVKEFIGHLFHQMSLSSVLMKPNAILMFCEPLEMSPKLRIQLLNYLFLYIKISRVCFIPKPLAISALVGLDTCIVVDSGALNTSVSIVINGQMPLNRWRQLPIGGWHVAENIKQAMQWQPEEYTEIPVLYLDSMTLKKKCRLSYNFFKEQHQRGSSRKEDINLIIDCSADCKKYWRVSLGEELFLAPEIMYASLNVPQTIKDIMEGLPDVILKNCLGHIIITGGNTDLAGFRLRIMRDVCELFPEFKSIVNVQSLRSSSSWNGAMGSTHVPVSRYSATDDERNKYVPGVPFWMSREEYILYGSDVLPS